MKFYVPYFWTGLCMLILAFGIPVLAQVVGTPIDTISVSKFVPDVRMQSIQASSTDLVASLGLSDDQASLISSSHYDNQQIISRLDKIIYLLTIQRFK